MLHKCLFSVACDILEGLVEVPKTVETEMESEPETVSKPMVWG